MRKILILSLLIFSYMPQASTQPIDKMKVVQYLTACDPSLKAYEYVGFKGSGKFKGYEYKCGKLASTPTMRSYTPSNGYYNFTANIYSYKIIECDSVLLKQCISTKFGTMFKHGSPSNNYNGEQQEVKTDTTHTTLLAYEDLQELNDSTYLLAYESGYYRKITFSKTRFVIETPYEYDLWNISMELNEYGFPTHIYSKAWHLDIRYKYVQLDSNDNWVVRESINENGEHLSTVNREIEYCSKCSGKGKVYICPKCHGTGRVKPRRNAGPDESVGICPRCGGKKTGGKEIQCPECRYN